VDVTVAIPNGDLHKVTEDQGFVDWVVGQLHKHRRIINLVYFLFLFLINDPLCLSSSSSALHFSDYSFLVHHPVNGDDRHSLHMQWHLTLQSHGSFSQREQLFFVLDHIPCSISTINVVF
jgi:hypothetical protein